MSMATSVKKKVQNIKTVKINHSVGAMTAGQSLFSTITVPSSIVGKTLVSTTIGYGHPGGAIGLQVSGSPDSTIGSVFYLSCYAPRAVTENVSVIFIYISYYDN